MTDMRLTDNYAMIKLRGEAEEENTCIQGGAKNQWTN
jgi:hypothetical protein